MFTMFAALLMIVEVNLLGRLNCGEIFLFLFLFLGGAAKIRLRRGARTFYALCALWLIGAIISDLYRGTAFEDFIRGWLRIIVFMVNFAAIGALVGNSREKLNLYIFGLFIAGAVKVSLGLYGGDIADEYVGNGWKFGYGQLFTATMLLLSGWLAGVRAGPIAYVIPYVAPLISLLSDARNLFALSVFTAVGNGLSANGRRALSGRQMRVAALVFVIVGVGLYSIYAFTAGSGLLGPEAAHKYQAQTGGQLNFLVAGRHELLASIPAIEDSPILGHGSFAHDRHYVVMMWEKMLASGIPIEGDLSLVSDQIPTHSHFFAAWVESGILGAIFWGWAFYIGASGLYATFRNPNPYLGFHVFVGLSLLWDILFSPFGLDRRLVTSAWLYLMLWNREEFLRKRAVDPEPVSAAGVGAAEVLC